MNTISRYALLLEEEEMTTTATTPAPVTEADKARQWLAGLNLDAMQNNDVERAEFYKYQVAVMRGERAFYLSTRSPQQQQHSYSHTTYARGDKESITEGMERFIKEMERKVDRRNEQKEAKRQARAAFVNPYKVGDFLYSSWGYEQTNREFYQILEVRDLALRVREVAQNRERTGYDTGTCSPIRDHFTGSERWITIQVNARGYHSVPSPIHGNLYAYEGKPVYFSDGY